MRRLPDLSAIEMPYTLILFPERHFSGRDFSTAPDTFPRIFEGDSRQAILSFGFDKTMDTAQAPTRSMIYVNT
jgi:hypothetical protein